MFGFFRRKPKTSQESLSRETNAGSNSSTSGAGCASTELDLSSVDSRAKAQSLFSAGRLGKLYMRPLEFGGEDNPLNTLFVPQPVVNQKAAIDLEVIRPLVEAGRISTYTANAGDSEGDAASGIDDQRRRRVTTLMPSSASDKRTLDIVVVWVKVPPQPARFKPAITKLAINSDRFMPLFFARVSVCASTPLSSETLTFLAPWPIFGRPRRSTRSSARSPDVIGRVFSNA